MIGLKLKYVIDFLQSRGWTAAQQGKRFVAYQPPLDLDLPLDFRLELPRTDQPGVGMEIYLDGILSVLKDLYKAYKQEDFLILLANQDSILSTRIMDEDTKDGTIQFNKLSKVYDLQKKILKQSVAFLLTRQPIFAQAKTEAELFIEYSRSLPTAKGSFITKLQLPESVSSPNAPPPADKVVDQFFKSIDFIQKEVVNVPIDRIDKNYVEDHRDYINIELLSSINNFYKGAQIDHVEFSFYNNRNEAFVETEGLLGKTDQITRFIRQSREVIIHEIPLKLHGLITKLNSVDPTSDRDNSISVDIQNAEEVKKVKVFLSSRAYKIAVDAHSQKRQVMIEGIAKLNGNQYVINYPDKFEIVEDIS
jgi:hypothetical protein